MDVLPRYKHWMFFRNTINGSTRKIGCMDLLRYNEWIFICMKINESNYEIL